MAAKKMTKAAEKDTKVTAAKKVVKKAETTAAPAAEVKKTAVKKEAVKKAAAPKAAEVKEAVKKEVVKEVVKKEAAKKEAPKKEAVKKAVVKKAAAAAVVKKAVEKKPAVAKKSVQEYKDVINWKKWEAHNMNWLYIEINAGDIMTELEAGVNNIKTVVEAILDSMLEGDTFIVESEKPSTKLTVRYYCDNLSEERRKYRDVNG